MFVYYKEGIEHIITSEILVISKVTCNWNWNYITISFSSTYEENETKQVLIKTFIFHFFLRFSNSCFKLFLPIWPIQPCPPAPKCFSNDSPQLQPLSSSTIKITTSVEQPAKWKNATIKHKTRARKSQKSRAERIKYRSEHVKEYS